VHHGAELDRRGAAIAVVTAWTLGAQAAELRLLTWSGYAPDEVIAEFKKATGHDVKVTTSNNEDMISKLRATGGAGKPKPALDTNMIRVIGRVFGIQSQRSRARVVEDICLARHDGVRTIGKAGRRERPCPLGVSGDRGGSWGAIDHKMHGGIGEAGPAQRIVRRDASTRRRSGAEGKLGGDRRCRACRRNYCRACVSAAGDAGADSHRRKQRRASSGTP